jgi:hypothetical protein
LNFSIFDESCWSSNGDHVPWLEEDFPDGNEEDVALLLTPGAGLKPSRWPSRRDGVLGAVQI